MRFHSEQRVEPGGTACRRAGGSPSTGPLGRRTERTALPATVTDSAADLNLVNRSVATTSTPARNNGLPARRCARPADHGVTHDSSAPQRRKHRSSSTTRPASAARGAPEPTGPAFGARDPRPDRAHPRGEVLDRSFGKAQARPRDPAAVNRTNALQPRIASATGAELEADEQLEMHRNA